MRREEFSFDSRDNHTKIHAIRWMPDGENVTAIVQIVHGMAEYAARYEEFAAYLTERGYVVTGEDHLGHGKSVPEGGIRGYFCEQDPATVAVRDVHRLKKMTQEIYPGVPYFVVGHSMGSYIARNYMFRYGSGVDGIVLLGTGAQSALESAASLLCIFLIGALKGEKHVSGLLDRVAFGKYNARVKDQRTEADWLSRDAAKVDEYLADGDCGFRFTVNGFKTLVTLIARAGKKKNLKKIPENLPVYMLSGEEDPVGGYTKGVKKAFHSMKNAGMKAVELKLYPGARHELLNEMNRQDVMEDIEGWLAKILASRSAI